MMDEIRKIKSTSKDLRNFGFIIGAAFAIIAFFLYKSGHRSYSYLLYSALTFQAVALILPEILLPLQKIWMVIGILIGWLMTRIILSILFYFILTPVSLLAKLFFKQFLNLGFDKPGTSYWEYRKPYVFNRSDYERQF
ncbi:MAG: hypothetical protein HY606_04920 [Planctomycetes bacterium]|nr:hypothetical protein [Planctomycetota bacterium]